MNLSERIERVYLASTGRATPYGARAWFARQARVHPWSVTRWLTGRRRLSGSSLRVLEMLEERAGYLTPSGGPNE